MNLTAISKSKFDRCKASMRKMSYNIDPFTLLKVYVQGTRDLFPNDLLARIDKICTDKDVIGYLDLSSELDALSKNYESESPELVKGHRMLCSFLKKYPFEDVPGLDPEATSIRNWKLAENQCRETNLRLRKFEYSKEGLPSFIHRARKLIADALGDLDPADRKSVV